MSARQAAGSPVQAQWAGYQEAPVCIDMPVTSDTCPVPAPASLIDTASGSPEHSAGGELDLASAKRAKLSWFARSQGTDFGGG